MRFLFFCLFVTGVAAEVLADDRYNRGGAVPLPISGLPAAESPAREAGGPLPPSGLPVPPAPSATPAPRPTFAAGASTPTSPRVPPAYSNPPAGSRPVASSYTQPRSATSSTGGVYRASGLMRNMMKPPSGSRLQGTPVRLEEVVASGDSRSAQTQRILAYWDLCSSTTDYYLGMAEAVELQLLRRDVGDNAVLRQAGNLLRTRTGTSYLAAVAAQRRLASLMNRTTLPLPGDLPLCGEYRTRFDQVFAGRASEEARALVQLIPLRYAELSSAAAAVTRAEQFVDEVKVRDANGAAMVRALELLALNRRAFVQIAKDYNRQITRYTELSRPGDIDTSRLVAMLVERPGASTTAAGNSPLQFRPGRR